MGALLNRLVKEADPASIKFGADDRQVAMLRERLKAVTEWKLRMPLEYALAKSLLADGQNNEAPGCLDGIERSMGERSVAFTRVVRQEVRMVRALAQMRIAETENPSKRSRFSGQKRAGRSAFPAFRWIACTISRKGNRGRFRGRCAAFDF